MDKPPALAHNITVGKQLWAAAASAVLLQPTATLAEPSNAVELQPIVVTGKRASLASAQEVKQEKQEIVDAVVADDLHKLPDFNVTDALQRVTGIQIGRDRGEGSTVVVRGLTQIETTLNGREAFSAGTGRTLDFADIPAEMVSAIHVYKTSSAEHVEGGIGGLIDLRTRHPFDFKGAELVGSARHIYGNLAGEGKPQFSLLASNRWKVAAGGRFIDPDLAEQMAFEVSGAGPLVHHDCLSDREFQILRLLARGVTVNDIAEQLAISNKTVSTHKARLMEKMGFVSNADLVRYAVGHGLVK